MDYNALKIYSNKNNKIALKIIPGHFATTYSHVNYYIDVNSLKTRQSEALEVAKVLEQLNPTDIIVDTIVCMDGCEIIGGFLAEEFSKAGILSMNKHKTIYIISPEYNSYGQLVFRENNQPAIMDKHVLLLVAFATTGTTIQKSIECIKYYGGKVQSVNAIFSATDEIDGHKINSIFKQKDFPGYNTYNVSDCPFCKQKLKIDAIINSYGYTKLN